MRCWLRSRSIENLAACLQLEGMIQSCSQSRRHGLSYCQRKKNTLSCSLRDMWSESKGNNFHLEYRASCPGQHASQALTLLDSLYSIAPDQTMKIERSPFDFHGNYLLPHHWPSR